MFFLGDSHPFSSNGLATGCSVKTLPGHMCGLTVPVLIPSAPVSDGVEIRQGCQFVSCLVRPFPSSLVVLVGSCHVVLDPTCQGFVIWGGINAPMVLPPDHWNRVITNASVLCVGFCVILKIQQRSFLMDP